MLLELAHLLNMTYICIRSETCTSRGNILLERLHAHRMRYINNEIFASVDIDSVSRNCENVYFELDTGNITV